ncbi:MAG: VCBS domain-containing protein, partial [Gammaproteobacteria bacterium]
ITVDALIAGATLVDNITVASADGTTQMIAITITGANDSASISGSSSGAVTEDSGVPVSGSLSVSDVDTGEAVFNTTPTLAASYGIFEIDSAGTWTYDLDDSNPTVNALIAGATLTDTINVKSIDGTATQAITITITGTDEGFLNADQINQDTHAPLPSPDKPNLPPTRQETPVTVTFSHTVVSIGSKPVNDPPYDYSSDDRFVSYTTANTTIFASKLRDKAIFFPSDLFDLNGNISLTATLSNGLSLPPGIDFNSESHTLQIHDHLILKPIELSITATDSEGNKKTIFLKILPGNNKTQQERISESSYKGEQNSASAHLNHELMIKPGLTEQLSQTGSVGFFQQRLKLLDSLKDNNKYIV